MNNKKKDEYGTYEYAEGIGKEYANMNYDTFKQGSDYAGLKKTYVDSGQKAMKDTVGQVSARTGGMASSYAQTAGQQAYGNWMSRLEDAAYSMYGAKKDEKLNEYNLAKDAANTNKALTDEAEAKAKAEADEEYAKNKQKLMTHFALGGTATDGFKKTAWAFANGVPTAYGFTQDEINDMYDEFLASQPAPEEETYTQMTPAELGNLTTILRNEEMTAAEKRGYLNLLAKMGYLDDTSLDDIIDLYGIGIR